jgi:tRNA-splicing ligase RtcB
MTTTGTERREPAPWTQFGSGFEPTAIQQMENACRLPIAVRGALMPDAHQGYGLPIGGVLATDGAVIPYAVGVDIACRMRMTVTDLPLSDLANNQGKLSASLEEETRFGSGCGFGKGRRLHHPVMDEDWSVSPITERNKDKAWQQLGTSGSGNHFAEFGVLTVHGDALGLEAGKYLALVSHSGSRNVGLTVANHYSKLARTRHPELAKDLQHLAWLDLDTEEGREYWDAMNLMGRYAAANHALIHQRIVSHLGCGVRAEVENHHNFAWREEVDGRECIVHRKGATPAGEGDVGVIPGSMATPGFVVRGKGNAASLNSASHGAGRAMSRSAAFKRFSWSDLKTYLKERGVTVLSTGVDEAPMAYKDIHEVMAAQKDLVTVLARFDPKLVKMAPGKKGGKKK